MEKCKNCKNGAYLKDEYGKGYLWCFEFEEDFNEDRICMPCHAYAPKTNADRIRAMDDTELAEFLLSDDNYIGCCTCKEPKDENGNCVGKCENEMLRWLKSEVGCE